MALAVVTDDLAVVADDEQVLQRQEFAGGFGQSDSLLRILDRLQSRSTPGKEPS